MTWTSTGIRYGRPGILGAMDRFLARNIETLLAIPGSKMFRQAEQDSLDTRGVQETVRQEILEYARDSAFGKEHGFGSISSAMEFCEAIPVRDYEGHRPWVERHQNGEPDVLFPGKPVMYNISSGTTAKAKLIPISEYNFERFIKKRSKIWLYGIQRRFPGVFSGKAITVVSPAVEGHTRDGTPYGSISGTMMQSIPGFMHHIHAAPYEVLLTEDYESRVYAILRLALACDVSIFLTANPSTVRNFLVRVDRWKERLIRDIRDGTMDPEIQLDPATRADLESRLSPAPERAAQLDRIAEKTGALRQADIWPNLKLVHTWKSGNCRLVVPKLRALLSDDVPILEFGYMSSEVSSTNLIDHGTDGSILAIRNAYYEFTRLDDGNDEGRRFYQAHELEEGQKYYIYVTTFSGLYRYDMNDVLQVVGFYNTTPILRFLYKGKGITSLQGEKVSEQQFMEAVKDGAEASGMQHEFYVGYADAERSGYTLYIELIEDHGPEDLDRLAGAVDEALCKKNVEYESKRKSKRLEPLRVVHAGKDFFDRYRDLRVQEGAKEGQLKWLNLSATPQTKIRMERLMSA